MGNPNVVLRTPDSHSVLPSGRLDIRTRYKYTCSFWVRTDEGRETAIVLDEKHSPVREGHVLSVVTAIRGDTFVIVGFVNHTTGKEHRVLSGKQVFRLLGIVAEQKWNEYEPGSLDLPYTRRRSNSPAGGQLVGMAGAGLLLVTALVVGLVQGGNGLCVVIPAILFAAVVASGLFLTSHRGVNRKGGGLHVVQRVRDQTRGFERDYVRFLQNIRPPA